MLQSIANGDKGKEIAVKVCILAAGAGLRMDYLTRSTNKVLLPLHDRAILSHIFERFPADSEFVVAIGYQGQKIKEYCDLAHPDLSVECIEVDPCSGPGSGPGRSLLACRNLLEESFFLVCGDTLWDLEWQPKVLDRNWVAIAPIEKERSIDFCVIEHQQGLAKQIHDKKEQNSPEPEAFTGLFFIKDHDLFFDGLDDARQIRGEHQLSNGLERLVERGCLYVEHLGGWLDTGNHQAYDRANRDCPNHMFMKEGAFFYKVGDNVIKYFSEPKIVEKRVRRGTILKGLVPEVKKATTHYMQYPYVSGETLDQVLNPNLFQEFMGWLDSHLWLEKQRVEKKDLQDSDFFYRQKTYGRIELFSRRQELAQSIQGVNGKRVDNISDIMNELDWSFLNRIDICRIHGDLLLNNVVKPERGEPFLLIDWRQDFAGNLQYGDRRYDLAKILLNLQYDFLALKKGEFLVKLGKQAQTQWSTPSWSNTCIDILKDYCSKKGVSFDDVELIKNLVLINIAPLHRAELAQLFWFEGLRQLSAN